MQNSRQFYPNYNNYSVNDSFHSNAPVTSIENDIFGPSSSNSMTTNQMTIVSQPTTSGMARSNKRKGTTDVELSCSPVSIYSDNSNYSEGSYQTFSQQSVDTSQNLPQGRSDKQATTTSGDEASSDDDDDNNDAARKREKHTQVEAHRRALEKAHFRELSMLIANRNDSKATKLHHLDLLKIAADKITEMNVRHKNDPLRPSNLTDNELNFLTMEASNSFLFVTTIEPAIFRILHVTDAITRILNTTPEQWREQNFLSFLHPDDLMRFRAQLMSLNQRIGMSIHLECRLRQGNSEMYSSVTIDGMAKIIDRALKPVPTNGSGFLAFVGICHLPLINKYSETNMRLYRNPQVYAFRCRCTPNDWKIFLVDRSVSTLPSVSYDVFRHKSILDFIHPHEHALVHQALLRSATAPTNETITCSFTYPNLNIAMPMTLEIRSFFNSCSHQANFIELTFKDLNNSSLNNNLQNSMTELFNDTKEIDKLLEPDSTIPVHQTVGDQFSHHPTTTTNAPYYYSNEWSTKDELF